MEYEVATLHLLTPQADLPAGPTWRCSVCGTRVRVGQPHRSDTPRPHQAYQTMLPWDPPEPSEVKLPEASLLSESPLRALLALLT